MGLLDRIGAFERYKVSPTQGTSGLMTGAGRPMSPFAQQAARQIGGLLGMDMRTPQEKVQAELTQVKDPMSPEGLLQRAQIIAANATDAQSLQVAAALATEGRRLQTAKTTKERAAKGRAGDIAFLKENPEYVKYVDDYESFAIGPEFVAKLRQEQVAEDAAERAAGLGRRQRTRTYTTLGKLYDVPEETQASIEAGELSYLDVEDFKKLYKPENQKAETVNFEVYINPNDKSQGTKIIALNQRDDGKVLDPTTRKWKEIYDVGVARETRAVEKETGEAPTTKETLRTTAAGSVVNFAKQLSGLSGTAQRGTVLGLVETPTARMVGGFFDSDSAKRANQIKIAKDAIAQSVGRDLSGGQIKEQEMKDFRVQLVPTFTDFTDNDAIFTKLVNTSLGLSIAANTALDRGAKANEQGVVPFTGEELNQALAKIAATPVTPEIQKLVDEGKFDEAIEARVNQVLGGEQGEISIESLRAKYG